MNSLFLSCRFEADREGKYNEYVYNFFKCLSPERLQYAEGYYAEQSRVDELWRCDGYLVQRRCPHLKADLARFGEVEDGHPHLHHARLAVRPGHRPLPDLRRRADLHRARTLRGGLMLQVRLTVGKRCSDEGRGRVPGGVPPGAPRAATSAPRTSLPAAPSTRGWTSSRYPSASSRRRCSRSREMSEGGLDRRGTTAWRPSASACASSPFSARPSAAALQRGSEEILLGELEGDPPTPELADAAAVLRRAGFKVRHLGSGLPILSLDPGGRPPPAPRRGAARRRPRRRAAARLRPRRDRPARPRHLRAGRRPRAAAGRPRGRGQPDGLGAPERDRGQARLARCCARR